MNIAVYIKAMVDPDKIVDDISLNSNADSRSLLLNPYDKNAIELALQMKEKYSGEVTAVSLGSNNETEKVLREALSLGVDHAVKVDSSKIKDMQSFSASIGFILAKLPLEDVTYFITGRESADDNQSITGAGIAESLNLNFVDNVDNIEFLDDKTIKATSTWDKNELTGIYKGPMVISVTDTINTPRLPSFKAKMKAKKAVLKEAFVSDLISDDNIINVKSDKLFIPEIKQKDSIIFNLEEDSESVNELLNDLKKNNIL